MALLLLCTTCITPLEIETDFDGRIMVVDGFITDDFGPHEILLSRVAKFEGTTVEGSILPIDEAEVYIVDNEGVRTDLNQEVTTVKEIIPPGLFSPLRTIFRQARTGYRTPSTFRGEFGKSYTLHIITAGRTYESTPQTMPSGPEIDTVLFDYNRLPGIDDVTFESGVDVSVRWQDPAEEENYYSWNVNGIYLIETPPKVPPPVAPDPPCLYDPTDNCCSKCWIMENNSGDGLRAYLDDQTNGQEITLKVGFIQDNGLRFANQTVPEKQYYVEVEQFSVTKDAFAFNNLLQSQLEIDGDIFDPPPATVRGNIFNVNDEDEVVIGLFGVTAVRTKSAFITRDMLEDIQRWPEPCGDCRVRAGATVETPEPFR